MCEVCGDDHGAVAGRMAVIAHQQPIRTGEVLELKA
jgi:hypothetical protein